MENPLHIVGRSPDYFLIYFGRNTPDAWRFALPQNHSLANPAMVDGMCYHVDILDAWNTTVTPVDETFTLTVDRARHTAYAEGFPAVTLAGTPYTALRIHRI